MLAGSTADRVGRRRVFQTGLVTFSLGSLLCALAPSLPLLVAARVLQAIGGSMLNPVAMSIIRNVFEDPQERARAIGVWGGVVGVSFALGPILGGALVDSVGWRAVFLVNLPVGLAALVLTALFVPESRAERPRRIDPVGQVLVILGLGGLTWAIIEGHQAGWLSGEILTLFVLAIGSLAALVAYEWRREQPLIEIRFFASAPFSGASAIAVCAFAALGGFLFLNTLYLQEVRRFSPLHAGLYMLPVAGMTLVFGPLSGRLVGSRGARPSLLMAGCALTASAIMLTRLSVDTSTVYLLGAYVVFGFRLRTHQSPDHQHRRVRHALLAGRRGRRGGLHQPPGGPDARRGGDRRRRGWWHLRSAGQRLRRRHPSWVVDHRRARRRDPCPGRPQHHAVGAAHRSMGSRSAVVSLDDVPTHVVNH